MEALFAMLRHLLLRGRWRVTIVDVSRPHASPLHKETVRSHEEGAARVGVLAEQVERGEFPR
jgi:hypothetical protein